MTEEEKRGLPDEALHDKLKRLGQIINDLNGCLTDVYTHIELYDIERSKNDGK